MSGRLKRGPLVLIELEGMQPTAWVNPNAVRHANVRQLPLVTAPVDRRGAHSEHAPDVARGEQLLVEGANWRGSAGWARLPGESGAGGALTVRNSGSARVALPVRNRALGENGCE